MLVGSAGGGGGAGAARRDLRRPGLAGRARPRRGRRHRFVGVAAYQAYLGLSRKFLSYTKTQYMSPPTLRRFTALGVTGHLARAVTFGLVGSSSIKAAIEYDPSEAVGIDGALQRLTTHSYGTAALVVVAVGLIAFGVYSVVDARHRAI